MRGSVLENLELWCQVAPHNSPVGLLSVMSRALCGCAASERPVITAEPCGKAAASNPNKIPSDKALPHLKPLIRLKDLVNFSGRIF